MRSKLDYTSLLVLILEYKTSNIFLCSLRRNKPEKNQYFYCLVLQFHIQKFFLFVLKEKTEHWGFSNEFKFKETQFH